MTERRYDVYRDKDGNPVTITPEQCSAIRHAFETYQQVIKDEVKKGVRPSAAFDQDAYMLLNLVSKSCLMGRMLYEGRAPLDDAPPVIHAAPAYHLRDPELCPICGGERNEPGLNLVTSIDPAHDMRRYFRGEQIVGKTITRTTCAEDWHPHGR